MMDMMQLIQMLRGSGDPMQMLTGMARNNLQIGQVLQMVNGKTPAEMQQMAYEAARQRGVDLNQLSRQLGIKLPR